MQGPHHVAQMFRNTRLPFKVEGSIGLPLRSESLNELRVMAFPSSVLVGAQLLIKKTSRIEKMDK